jgi:FtsP/CotA-like multicopper oxidase with cupredoxin domain
VTILCIRVTAASSSCERPAPGSAAPEPADLHSVNGELKVELTIHNSAAPDGSTRYCYLDQEGNLAPNLRLHPGDLLTLTLRNELKAIDHRKSAMPDSVPGHSDHKMAVCSAGPMNATSTNLHFPGLTVPPKCHQDDVLNTLIASGSEPFEYKFRIPENQPPGLYWYHPHVHGFTNTQVLGGASGAMIIEGIEDVDHELAGLPERVFVIRDQDVLNPDAPPSKSEPVLPKMMIDRDGDAANNGTGFEKPAKDLSVNFVPVPYPDYPPASIKMKPTERQLWRVLNASAVTYLNLAIMIGHNPGGENDPNRTLATIDTTNDAPEPRSRLSTHPKSLPVSTTAWLGGVAPVRTRHFYFSEKLQDPNSPTSAVEFYLTAEGQTPAPFDPNSTTPNIVAKQGTVEDWIIENRSQELHAFHAHQLHFMLLDYLGIPVNEPFLHDTVNVPYLKPRDLTYPSVRIRMDFRDPNSVGTFVYHCHLLEHEDGGMMGTIRVEAAKSGPQNDMHRDCCGTSK